MWENKLIDVAALQPYAGSPGLNTASDALLALLAQQRATWPQLAQGVDALQKIETKTVALNAWPVTVQFNPARATSSLAKTDAASIAKRPCFLCATNQSPLQLGIRTGRFILLGNPFPIVPEHVTIVCENHEPQNLAGHLDAFVDLTRQLGDRFTTLYNGPQCGASAPDHMHFQASPRGLMPVERQLKQGYIFAESKAAADTSVQLITDTADAKNRSRCVISVSGSEPKAIADVARRILKALPTASNGSEPMVNVFANYEAGRWTIAIFPRAIHRPRRYFSEGPDQMLLSPGILDLGGLLITVRETDFQKANEKSVAEVYQEVILPPEICKTALNGSLS